MAVRRRIVREKVLQALYAHEISGDPAEHVIACILPDLKPNRPAYEFARSLVLETIEQGAHIDQFIRKKVANWDFQRIAIIDRLVLRMAICELLHFKEIPPKVSIDEAIELAKLFSTDKSGQFVNGVLDAVMDDLRTSGGLEKTGRGLHEGNSTKAS